MSVRRWVAALLLGAVCFLAVGRATTSSAAPGAETQLTLLPTTAEPAPTTVEEATTTETTEEETTTTETPTTRAPTPATVRSTTTTEAFEPDDTTVEVPTTGEPTTTTSSVPLLVDGPPVDPQADVEDTTTTSSTAPVASSSDDGKTSRQVTLAVSGLLVLALVFAILTVWYWRRTKPRVAPAGTR